MLTSHKANRQRAFAIKLVTTTVPAMVIALLVLAAAVEAWVRITADPKRGTPGFFLSDAARRDRLAAHYSGWFAGVPVHINGLELRDNREYDLEKKPNTFRILALGDSVTFGHGSVYEHTYPYLLEQQLRRWRPDVDWQVWNAAVPGYNTSQELAQLLEVGPRFKPDLVIVGFFDNDIIDNEVVVPPDRFAILQSDVLSVLRRHLYSLDLYKRWYLTLRWRLFASDEYRRRLEHIATEESLLADVGRVAELQQQQLTPYERLTDEQVRRNICRGGERPSATLTADLQHDAGWANWIRAVRRLQELHKAGAYSIVFFVNMVPPVCPGDDFFFDGASLNRFFLDVLGQGTPAVSAYDTFLHRRPSQMPNAKAHAIGNSNLTKAEALFGYLTNEILPTFAHPAFSRVAEPRVQR